MIRFSSLILAFVLISPRAESQDFYDVSILRNVDIQFHDANWWNLLLQNYNSQTNILADMTVEGVVYPEVGVRIRGNTSYWALPPGSRKVSLNIEVDFVHDQDVMGYTNLNFNNAFRDPTFCREVVYHNILAQWIPSGRANHVVVSLQGENWGVYANVQQFDKTMLEKYFADEDGMRVKCANNPSGPGLQYEGSNPNDYSEYEIKDDGGLTDPVGALIDICFAVSEVPPNQWEIIDETFAIDPSIWTAVMENLWSDDDSYVNKGCDFVVYRDPTDGRAQILQTDGNETWTDSDWSATRNFTRNDKPVLSNVLNSTEMRGRYLAHFRAAFEFLNWSYLQTIFYAHRDLIDAAVQNDDKKIYSYQDFLDNFTVTVDPPGGGPFGGPIIGIWQYVNERRQHLLSDPELNAAGPTIQNVGPSDDTAGVPITITATVTGPDPISSVSLYFRQNANERYARLPMLDDGLSGDGAPGDGVYGVALPFVGQPGQTLPYYVGATAQNTYSSQAFEPVRSENGPAILTFRSENPPIGVVINEFLASNDTVNQDEQGEFEDWVELYNSTAGPLDLSHCFLTDNIENSDKWQIPTGTVLGAGETLIIWTDDDPGDGPLHATFKLSADGEDVALFADDAVTLLDGLSFGPQVTDVSTARLDDGGGPWITMGEPTPDAENAPGVTGYRNYSALDSTKHTIQFEGTGVPNPGASITFEVRTAPANELATIPVSLSPQYLPFPGSDSVLLVSVPFALTITVSTNGSGAVDLPVTLPSDPIMNGVIVYMQVLTASGGGLIVSNGLEMLIGP